MTSSSTRISRSILITDLGCDIEFRFVKSALPATDDPGAYSLSSCSIYVGQYSICWTDSLKAGRS